MLSRHQLPHPAAGQKLLDRELVTIQAHVIFGDDLISINCYTHAMNDDKSKSEHKRDAMALKEFGEKLLCLSPRQLEQLTLPTEIQSVISEFKRIKSQLAQKRHIQHLANVLRHMPEEILQPIMTDYHNLMSSADLNSPQFRLIETWRQRLIEEGKSALTEFLTEYPCHDVQRLRHLIRKATPDAEKGQHSKASTLLFRFIREHIS